mmetsp:Transcript_49544/g.115627  ORF Transcript_49544/g.115627 Transcript_49544/m.115627 type:complete len:253 (-) Transcript_49544:1612-2370(-)
MPVVDVRAVEGNNHANVEEERLSSRLNAQNIQNLNNVVTLEAGEINFFEEHDLFHVHSIRVQHPFLRPLKLPRALIVLRHLVFTHENFLDAFDALQGHLLENVRLNGPQEFEVLVLCVVMRVIWPRHHADLVGLLEESYSEDKLFCVVICENAVKVILEVPQNPFSDFSHGQLLVGHDLVAELDTQQPRAASLRVLVFIRQLVIQADPLLVFFNQGVLWVWVPENLRERSDLLKCGVLQHALHILGALLVLT